MRKCLKNIIVENKNCIIMVGITFLTLLLYGKILNIKDYLYDSLNYFLLSQSFEVNGDFSFLYFPESHRGFLFPFVLYLYTKIGTWIDPMDAIMIGNIIFVILLFFWAFPSFVANVESNRIRNDFKLLIPISIFLVYWKDLIYYPLSDLYALGFFVFGLMITKYITRVENSKVIKFLLGIIVGVCFYATYNTRTIYLFAIVGAVLLFIILNRKDKFMILYIVGIVLGCFMAALPQIVINYQYYNSLSPFVITSNEYSGGLMMSQVYWGMMYQRYDTYVGDVAAYPAAGVLYYDNFGNAVLSEMGITSVPSILQYCQIWIKYPFDMLGLVGRHVVNMLCMPFGELYIFSLKGKWFYLLLNYIIIFMTGITIYLSKSSEKRPINNWFYISFIPCIMIALGAVETRFALPIYIWMYYSISFFDWKTDIGWLKKKWWKICIAFGVFLALMCAICGQTFCSTPKALFLE